MRNQIPIDNLIVHGLKMEAYSRGGRLHTATNSAPNLARCFECRKNFNLIDMVMATGKCSFVEAVEYLKRRYLGQQPSSCEQDGYPIGGREESV